MCVYLFIFIDLSSLFTFQKSQPLSQSWSKIPSLQDWLVYRACQFEEFIPDFEYLGCTITGILVKAKMTTIWQLKNERIYKGFLKTRAYFFSCIPFIKGVDFLVTMFYIFFFVSVFLKFLLPSFNAEKQKTTFFLGVLNGWTFGVGLCADQWYLLRCWEHSGLYMKTTRTLCLWGFCKFGSFWFQSVMNKLHTISVPYSVMKICPLSWVQRVHTHKGTVGLERHHAPPLRLWLRPRYITAVVF